MSQRGTVSGITDAQNATSVKENGTARTCELAKAGGEGVNVGKILLMTTATIFEKGCGSMSQVFLKKIKIDKVRHLQDIEIPLSETERKHLILTGKNGSGKTSIIKELVNFFEYLLHSNFTLKTEITKEINSFIEAHKKAINNGKMKFASNIQDSIEFNKIQLKNWSAAYADCDYFELREKYKNSNFIISYYPAERRSKNEVSNTIETITINDTYSVKDRPGIKLVKYMVAKKATQAFAQQKGNLEKSKEIEEWFIRFENILKKIFDDQDIKLDFDIDSFKFSILQSGHEPFDFNTMSDGYSAVFDIINDLIMRTEKKGATVEGIVLIDEIETHLHLELQKSILPFLTGMFPNIQFIVTTHSPFILNSIDNAVIFDVENKTLVKDGMGNLPYEGIVEGYFGADRLSQELRTKFERYKELSAKEDLTDEDWAEIGDLETYLDEIPDYLAIDITSEYSRLKLENENK